MANVIFVTQRGLRIFEVEDFGVQRLADTLVMLRKEQVAGNKYLFGVTVTTDNETVEMMCSDILVDYQTFHGG